MYYRRLISEKYLLIVYLALLSACGSENAFLHQATIIPAVNPKFDTVTLVAKSDTADGEYIELMSDEFSYNLATETIVLADGLISVNGNFIQISGLAAVHDTQEIYTVYTYLPNNDSSVAANELTTYAVAAIVAKNRNSNDELIDNFDDAVLLLTHQTGLSVSDIVQAKTAQERESLPNLQASLAALADSVEGDSSAVSLPVLAAKTPPNMDQIAWGALLYDNWMSAPSEAPVAGKGATAEHSGHRNNPQARSAGESDEHRLNTYGENKQPSGLVVKIQSDETFEHLLDDEGEEQQAFRRFARCKECHGWDQLGIDGSFAIRSRGNKILVNPNDSADIGEFRNRPGVSENSNLTNQETEFVSQNIVPITGLKRNYGNIDSDAGITDTTVDAIAVNWNAKIDIRNTNNIRLSDLHPDFTRTKAADEQNSANPFEGVSNDIVPSQLQIEALVAFLNYDGGRLKHVMSWNSADTAADKNTYALIEDASISDGEQYYAAYCFRCHNAPNTALTNPLHHKYENIMGFLSKKDGDDNIIGLNQVRLSALFHVARWGKSGKVMSRDRIAYPTAHDVSNLIAYLLAFSRELVSEMAADNIESIITVNDSVGNTGLGNFASGKALYESACQSCHQAHDEDDGTNLIGEDVTFRCHHHDENRVISSVDGNCSSGSSPIPNLAPHKVGQHKIIRHYAMKNNLQEINKNMSIVDPLTQQNINDLAEFFNRIGVPEVHE